MRLKQPTLHVRRISTDLKLEHVSWLRSFAPERHPGRTTCAFLGMTSSRGFAAYNCPSREKFGLRLCEKDAEVAEVVAGGSGDDGVIELEEKGIGVALAEGHRGI